ncbi:hypothetical protein PSAC2689_180090 [Paraburkholderia sacchari]
MATVPAVARPANGASAVKVAKAMRTTSAARSRAARDAAKGGANGGANGGAKGDAKSAVREGLRMAGVADEEGAPAARGPIMLAAARARRKRGGAYRTDTSGRRFRPTPSRARAADA